MKASQSLIICEGYHDRAFWAGILLASGCKDIGDRGQRGRFPVRDPDGKPVVGGDFGFFSGSGGFIRVTPAHGSDNILPLLTEKLEGRKSKPFIRIVVNVDSDLMADGSNASVSLSREAVLGAVRGFEPEAVFNSEGEIKIEAGATTVHLVPWAASDPATRGVPHQQTMERVICAALNSLYPARGEAVEKWLESRPEGPVVGPKAYAWSYLAGWYAEETGSYDGFCQMIWNRGEIAGQLRSRLEACGVWRVAQILAA